MRSLHAFMVTAVVALLLSACAGQSTGARRSLPPDIQQEISAGGTIWGETRANTRGSANSNVINE